MDMCCLLTKKPSENVLEPTSEEELARFIFETKQNFYDIL